MERNGMLPFVGTQLLNKSSHARELTHEYRPFVTMYNWYFVYAVY